MFTSRRKKVNRGVHYCEACTEVTTATQRAQRRHDHVRDRALSLTLLR